MDRGVQGKPLVSTKSQHGVSFQEEEERFGDENHGEGSTPGRNQAPSQRQGQGLAGPSNLRPWFLPSLDFLVPPGPCSFCLCLPPRLLWSFVSSCIPGTEPWVPHHWVTAEGSFANFTNYGYPCLLPQPSRHSWEPFATFEQRLALAIEVPQPRLYMSLVSTPGCARTLSPWMYLGSQVSQSWSW